MKTKQGETGCFTIPISKVQENTTNTTQFWCHSSFNLNVWFFLLNHVRLSPFYNCCTGFNIKFILKVKTKLQTWDVLGFSLSSNSLHHLGIVLPHHHINIYVRILVQAQRKKKLIYVYSKQQQTVTTTSSTTSNDSQLLLEPGYFQ